MRLARLVAATHPERPECPSGVRGYLRYGASPRAAIAMGESARAAALLAGRPNVDFADVERVATAARIVGSQGNIACLRIETVTSSPAIDVERRALCVDALPATADPAAYLAAHSIEVKDELLKFNRPLHNWTLAELTPALDRLAEGHSFLRGTQLFEAASCAACATGPGTRTVPQAKTSAICWTPTCR